MNKAVKHYLDSSLGNLIDSLAIAEDERTVKFALRGLARNTGFDHYVYMVLRAGLANLCTDWPDEWQIKYRSENYHRLDPMLVQAARTMRPVLWSQADKQKYEGEVRRFFEEARRYGISSGIALPIRGGFGSTVVLSLISRREEPSRIECKDVAYVATAVAFVHASLSRLALVGSQTAGGPLSPREVHCLSWASVGKTKAEIAQLLGLSEKTVRCYLESARQKLGATNVTHAVRLSVERRLL